MLTPGTRLGPYEVLAPLGAGGMGEVYRARDTRLGREVAIKVLPEALARDPERIARFEREARSASALSHAHTVAVFDVGRTGDSLYLVTEIVEGGNLREVIDRGPVPLRRAIDLAAQIASGLAAAHESGIVHRDLKPENVLIARTGEAKIADFGLAKLAEPEDGSGSSLPTSDGLSTSAGLVMGTVAYMSPEQAAGRKVDFRSDQFALGAILWEMLAGRPCFRRASAAETLSAVMRDEPEPLRTLNPAVPMPLAWILERCLAKEATGRYASTRDLAGELATVRDHLSDLTGAPIPVAPIPAAAGSRVRRFGTPAVIALLAAAVVAAGFLVARRRGPAAAPVIRFSILPPSSSLFYSRLDAISLAISPDGSRLAFIGDRTAAAREVAPATGLSTRIYVRPLSDLDSKPVPGTEGATSIFWSPDGGSLGFFAGGQLKRENLGSGSPVPVCAFPSGKLITGTWGAGTMLFASTFEGVIYRVPADGGTPAPFVRPDPARGETRMQWPHFLPDGRTFLYLAVHRDGAGTLMVGSLDGKPPRAVAPMSSRVEWTAPGDLVFAADGALIARSFDAGRARFTGPPLPLAPSVYSFFTSKWAGFSVSRNGSFAYLPKGNITRLTWFDRSGRNLGEIGTADAGETITLSISPDGRRAAFDRTRLDLGTFDLWMIDLERGVETRLTSDPNTEFDPVWLPDQTHLVYSVVHDYLPQIVRRDLGGGAEEPLLPPGTFQEAQDVWPDGRRLLFSQSDAKGGFGIWRLALEPGAKPSPVVVSKYQQEVGRLSPDGRFVAFLSNESGAGDAAYVQPVDAPAGRIRISPGTAMLLRWSRDGKEIFYTTPNGSLMSASVRTSPSLEVGNPVKLFSLPAKGWRAFDVAPDGRFLASVPVVSYATEPIDVVVSGTGGLPR
ncbi:MAG TPA: protein kinase [Thermoanaerobaculia bacterium]|nr:protein kinase [Thermoanaerobaculia bacterium]